MQTRTNSNGITSPLSWLPILHILDNVPTTDARANFGDSSREVNIVLKLEMLGIAFQVGTILCGKEEVRRFWSVAIIGEGGQLAGRDKL